MGKGQQGQDGSMHRATQLVFAIDLSLVGGYQGIIEQEVYLKSIIRVQTGSRSGSILKIFCSKERLLSNAARQNGLLPDCGFVPQP